MGGTRDVGTTFTARVHASAPVSPVHLLVALEGGAPALLEWVAHGLLPPPRSARGRCIVSKWPLITLELAEFVREDRDKGFALPEIRPLLVKAFGRRILQVVEEPRPCRGKDKAKAAASAKPAPKAATAAKQAAAKKAAYRAS